MARSKKVTKYMKLRKQWGHAEKMAATLRRKMDETFDSLSKTERREYDLIRLEEQTSDDIDPEGV